MNRSARAARMSLRRMQRRMQEKQETKPHRVHRHSDFEIYNGNGITIKTNSFSIALDPRYAVSVDHTFVSHAHIDHMHSPKGKSTIVASQETKELAKVRGYNLGEVR